MSSGHSELHSSHFDANIIPTYICIACPRKITRKDWPSCLCLLSDAHCNLLQLDLVAYRPLVALWHLMAMFFHPSRKELVTNLGPVRCPKELPFVRLCGVKPLGFSKMWRKPNSRCPSRLQGFMGQAKGFIKSFMICSPWKESVKESTCSYSVGSTIRWIRTLAEIVVNVSDVYLCAGSLQQVFLQRLQ